ncbi:MAG: HAD-IIIA family hydrolase, partial [Alphaproteobacteria bacterium]|nr:HAD-IIIA family hydrolase [Alphaproteobacteria bacterium]
VEAGTAGALLVAADRLDDQFLMLNGDVLFDINYGSVAASLRLNDIGVLALRRVDDPRRYGRVSTDENGRILAFTEKVPSAREPALVSGGVYYLRRAILSWIPHAPCSLEVDVFPRLAQERRLRGLEGVGYFLDIGTPESLEQGRMELIGAVQRPAMFFDRDGTLTVDDGYTYRPEDLEWLPGAIDSIRACNEAGWLVIVATNQSGLARGLYSEADMRRFHDAMQTALQPHGAHIDAFYFCPFHEDARIEAWRVANHPDRKPNPGMLRRAMLEWPIDRARSMMLGDARSDIAAAEAAGIRGVQIHPGSLYAAVTEAIGQFRHATRPALRATTHILKERAERAREWLFDAALPFWVSTGFDEGSGLFHERVSQAGEPLAHLPRRIRVQARQTFVFAAAGDLGWDGPWREATRAGAHVLLTKGLRADGGTRFQLSASGKPVDDRRDLYDLSFVTFALAHAARVLGDRPDLVGAAAATLDWLDRAWAHPAGGFLEGDVAPSPPRRQNPHMHLFEACLALFETTGDHAHLLRAQRLAELFLEKLFNAEYGALPEYFDHQWGPAAGDEGRIVEPGHHFEWSWLLHRFAKASGASTRAIAERLRVFAEVYGVDPATGITIDEVYTNGAPRALTSRLWPQTERLKANLARFVHARDPNAAEAAAQAFNVVFAHLDTKVRGLWHERRRADGSPIEDDAPASSLYHVTLAFAELIRVAEHA